MKALEAMECPVTGVIPHKERQRLTTYDNVFQGGHTLAPLVYLNLCRSIDLSIYLFVSPPLLSLSLSHCTSHVICVGWHQVRKPCSG